MPQHHSCTQKRKLSIIKNTTTQNKMQGKAAMIGLLHSGSLNAKDNCSMIKKVEKLCLDFSLTIHYNEYINSFFLLPIRQSVSSLAAERLCFRSFSIKQEYCGFFCDARIPLFTYHTKLHTLCEGIRRRFPDAFLFAGTTQSRRIKAHFLGKILNVLEAILSWIRKLWSATCSIISGSAISTALCVIKE